MSDHEIVIRPLIVSEHVHVNDTVEVIGPLDAQLSAAPCASTGRIRITVVFTCTCAITIRGPITSTLST